MNADTLREQLELQVVEMLKAKLDDGSLTEERSQAISSLVLEKLTPGMTLEEIFRVVPTLDDQFPELAPIILPLLREYETKIVGAARSNVSELIRQGQYDAAIKLADSAVKQEVKLVWQGGGKAD